MLPTPKDEFEEKAIADISAHGLHIINVFGENERPNFTYSVGLWHTFKHPEVIIIGLKSEISGWILNEISRNLKNGGEQYRVGEYYGDFLEGFDITFLEVAKNQYKAHVGWSRWLYKGSNFPLIQCVWPTAEGVFPWQLDASDEFHDWQPVLKYRDPD